MVSDSRIVLVATGLGRINRGFETFIADLATLLSQSSEAFPYVKVYGSKKLHDVAFPYRGIRCIFRDSKTSHRLFKTSSKRLRFERFTFFLSMIPNLLRDKPDVIYLGEYPIYCWLYKFRKITGLQYKLALYTGGQAIPGVKLFDPSKDFIHHITDKYLEECKIFPAERQKMLPHFIPDTFHVDEKLKQEILARAAGKKIVISVGAIEKSSKRMHWLVEGLAQSNYPVFPILLGEATADWDEIRQLLVNHFGQDGFILDTVPRTALGTYYKAADLFVSCSPKESFGLVLVEALSFGLPVICDDFPEVRFVLKEQANFIKMDGPHSIAFSIDNYLSGGLREYDEKKARDFASSNYSTKRLSACYVDMFRQL